MRRTIDHLRRRARRYVLQTLLDPRRRGGLPKRIMRIRGVVMILVVLGVALGSARAEDDLDHGGVPDSAEGSPGGVGGDDEDDPPTDPFDADGDGVVEPEEAHDRQ